jgi:hypothetical protein
LSASACKDGYFTEVTAAGKSLENRGLELQKQGSETDLTKYNVATASESLAEKPALGQEPVYQGKPLSAWVSKVGEIESDHVAEDAVAAIRAIGPEAVPFLLEWMPQPGAKGPVEGFPDWSAVEIAWWALGSAGKSAIPTLARILSEPRRTADDYSVWTVSVQAISHLGPDAIVPMLTKRGGPP